DPCADRSSRAQGPPVSRLQRRLTTPLSQQALGASQDASGGKAFNGIISAMSVQLAAVKANEKSTLANLLQLYMHDFSEVIPLDLSPNGRFEYRSLDDYFSNERHESFFILLRGRLAGFALLSCESKDGNSFWKISEFFVARGYRRRGVARDAVRLLFQRHPGEWRVSYIRSNTPAACFWPFIIDLLSDGRIKRTTQNPPEVEETRDILSFRVAEQCSTM
ncbi:GNAT family N-acetyltransferase, partial [Streptomyces collinus]|uniref:GNAT family N-acetyltransferase n=1 Tax=Streptomyces collinus TaxID=42684 RepID=UPI00368E5464